MTRKLIFSFIVLVMKFLFLGCKKKNSIKIKNEKAKTDKNIDKEDVDREIFVNADYIKNLMDTNDRKDFVIGEVSWGNENDSPNYLTKHIPGAIHIDTNTVEESELWNIKSPDEIKETLLSTGIDADTHVILYGEDTGVYRVAMIYLWAGVQHVKVLDGGLRAWEEAGYELESKTNAPCKKENFKLAIPQHPEYVLSLDQVIGKLEKEENFRLVSIRSEEEWLGKTSGYFYITKAGEPKGAIWGKSGKGNGGMEYYLKEDGRLKSFDEITEMWKNEGFSPKNELAFYCGTGWRATLPWLLMYQNGYDASVFEGGWNEWQRHDELEVQIGHPGSDNFKIEKVGNLPKCKVLL